MKLQKLSEAWFKLPKDPDKAEFKIKHLRSGEVADIQGATHQQEFEYIKDKKGKLQPRPVFKVDMKKETELTIVEAIVDWKKMFESDGKILECNEENKLRLCRELSNEDFVDFGKFIQKSRKALAKSIKKEEEKSQGN